MAEKLFSTILGKGDYTEAENIALPLPTNNTVMGLQTSPVAEQVASMHWNGQATRIAHREYIGSVSMSSGFAAAQYYIDPTSSFMFPWLSSIAPKFQKWKLLGCVFEYVPTSATSISAGSPAVGQVGLGILYDSYSPTPTSLQQMLNTQGAVSARPFDTLVCPVECDGNYTPTNPLYIAQLGGGPDNRFTSFGHFVVATQGPASYTNAGQLWVTYDMLLIGAYVAATAPSQELKIDSEFFPGDGTSSTTHTPATKVGSSATASDDDGFDEVAAPRLRRQDAEETGFRPFGNTRR